MSPFQVPRPPPSTPVNTAKLWDEYERQAVENATRRETTYSDPTCQKRPSTWFSSNTVLGIIKSYDPHSSPRATCPSPSVGPSPRFDFGFNISRKSSDDTSGATVAICKICQQPIQSSPGVCGQCKKTLILPLRSGETTPPLTPACRNFGSTDLLQLQKTSSIPLTPTSSPPKRKSRRQSATSIQLVDPPIRLSSLRPPPKPLTDSPRSSAEGPRPRKISLTDPNEPFLRLQISRKPVPIPSDHPSAPTTPPSTSHSHKSATRSRPFSLANVTTPPAPIATITRTTISRPSTRHTSATPSELSTMYPYGASSTTSSPPSLLRASYQLQHTTSAWDDWDSEEEEEKAGLVKSYWRGRRWRGSRGSLGGQGTGTSKENNEGKYERKAEAGRKRLGIARVIGCGCAED